MKKTMILFLILVTGLVGALITGCASSPSNYGANVHYGSSWGYHDYRYNHYRPPSNRPPSRPPSTPRPTQLPSRM